MIVIVNTVQAFAADFYIDWFDFNDVPSNFRTTALVIATAALTIRCLYKSKVSFVRNYSELLQREK